MHIVSGVALLSVATLIGLMVPFAFGQTGLDWTFSKPPTVLDD